MDSDKTVIACNKICSVRPPPPPPAGSFHIYETPAAGVNWRNSRPRTIGQTPARQKNNTIVRHKGLCYYKETALQIYEALALCDLD